jgi:hypothetical protein
MVESLPSGAADLLIGQNSAVEKKGLFPYFRITPKNPAAAAIEGYIYEVRGSTLGSVELQAKPTSVRRAVTKVATKKTDSSRFVMPCSGHVSLNV